MSSTRCVFLCAAFVSFRAGPIGYFFEGDPPSLGELFAVREHILQSQVNVRCHARKSRIEHFMNIDVVRADGCVFGGVGSCA
jgi:hypothetical protein